MADLRNCLRTEIEHSTSPPPRAEILTIGEGTAKALREVFVLLCKQNLLEVYPLELGKNLPSGVMEKLFTERWLTRSALLQNHPRWVPGEVAGHLLLQLSGTGGTAYASGARPWRSHPHWRSLVLKTTSVLQKPTIEKPLHLRDLPSKPNRTKQLCPFLLWCLSSTLYWQV